MPNPVMHFEIGCRDTNAAADFYAKLFGWTAEQQGPAAMINTGSSEGVQGHFTALGHEPHHYTMFYVNVDDIASSVAKAVSLGGKTIVPKQDIPNYGSFAWIADPDGNVIGLWKAA